MYVEYEDLWVAGGRWLFTSLAFMYWIWEDSQMHKKRAWPWLFLLSLGSPFETYIGRFYLYEVLAGRGIYPYLVPLFKYDTSHFAEPIWALDTLFFWDLFHGVVTQTIIYFVIFWVYRDCKKSGQRATPWIFAARFIQEAPFPITYAIPLGGYTGQIFIMIGYILHKHGYLRWRKRK